MKAIETMCIRRAIIFMFCLTIFLITGICYAEESEYPVKVEIINKSQAKYDTPENTLAALRSALVNEDLEWADEVLTKESAEEQKTLFEGAGIDHRVIFDLERDVNYTFIIDKILYKDAVVLVIEDHDKDGSITKIPLTFLKEDGKWKLTNKYAADVELHEYLDYKPGAIITSTVKIRPNRWNLNWYNWIKAYMEKKKWIKRIAERVSILCLIGNLKDNEGSPYSVKEIAPETILLNDILPSQPWRFRRREKIALILGSREDRYLRRRKGFKEWHLTDRFLKKYQGPVMLVKFNKFKAMETLSEMIPGNEYEITVAGELKDGKRFQGSAKITITAWKAKHRWKWTHPDWLNSDKDMDNWWNKEKDL